MQRNGVAGIQESRVERYGENRVYFHKLRSISKLDFMPTHFCYTKVTDNEHSKLMTFTITSFKSKIKFDIVYFMHKYLKFLILTYASQ